MTQARTSSNPLDTDPGSDRSLIIFGLAFSAIGALGILFFWVISAILLITENGGLILQIELDGLWLTAYWAYPFVAFAALAAAGVLYLMKRDQAALGVAGAPVALSVLYYLAFNLIGGPYA